MPRGGARYHSDFNGTLADSQPLAGCENATYFICFLTHSVETDFGRVMAVPKARLSTN